MGTIDDVRSTARGNEYLVRFHGRRLDGFWVPCIALLPRTVLGRTLANSAIRNHQIRFYEPLDTQECELVHDTMLGIAAVFRCIPCRQFFRDYVRHRIEVHGDGDLGDIPQYEPPPLANRAQVEGNMRYMRSVRRRLGPPSPPVRSPVRSKRRRDETSEELAEQTKKRRIELGVDIDDIFNEGFAYEEDDDPPDGAGGAGIGVN